mmetsp:Transcript_8431/g.25348  ORF Transcript_8431/g.25348 Transcript_8431/m.25348 type:complete len:128 (+) Transcript_8431:200-583(+)
MARALLTALRAFLVVCCATALRAPVRNASPRAVQTTGGPAAAAAAALGASLMAPGPAAATTLLALSEESGLPDPTVPVICFFFLIAAFAYTQFDMVGVTQLEEMEGQEGARRARDALARKRGYFRRD